MLKKLKEDIQSKMESQNPIYLVKGYIGDYNSTGGMKPIQERIYFISESTLNQWIEWINKSL